jgi:regulatory protein
VRPPKKLNSESEIYTAALRILMRRGHSVHEMRVALGRRCDDEALVRAVVDRLKREQLVDDARYAAEFARSRARNRKQGKFRIARELRARGVPDRHVETALEGAFAETDEAALLRKRIEQKLRMARGPLDEKKRASLYRSLMMAGFSGEMIRREMKKILKGDVPEIVEANLDGEKD